MALGKNLPTPYGVDAAYHRVVSVQVYYPDRCVDVTLAGYLDADARTANKSPLLSATGRLTFDEMGISDGEPTRAAIYGALKNTAEYEEASDV